MAKHAVFSFAQKTVVVVFETRFKIIKGQFVQRIFPMRQSTAMLVGECALIGGFSFLVTIQRSITHRHPIPQGGIMGRAQGNQAFKTTQSQFKLFIQAQAFAIIPQRIAQVWGEAQGLRIMHHRTWGIAINARVDGCIVVVLRVVGRQCNGAFEHQARHEGIVQATIGMGGQMMGFGVIGGERQCRQRRLKGMGKLLSSDGRQTKVQ